MGKELIFRKQRMEEGKEKTSYSISCLTRVRVRGSPSPFIESTTEKYAGNPQGDKKEKGTLSNMVGQLFCRSRGPLAKSQVLATDICKSGQPQIFAGITAKGPHTYLQTVARFNHKKNSVALQILPNEKIKGFFFGETVWMHSHPFLSTVDWFQDSLQIPKSTDVQISYMKCYSVYM